MKRYVQCVVLRVYVQKRRKSWLMDSRLFVMHETGLQVKELEKRLASG